MLVSTAATLRDQADNEPPDSPSPSKLRQLSNLAPAEEQPEWQSDIVDFGHELKSAVDNILHAYPKYTGFII